MIFLGVERKATAVAVARLNRHIAENGPLYPLRFRQRHERIIGGRIAITVFGNGEGAHSVRQRGNIAEVKHLTVRGKFRVKHAVQRQTGIFFDKKIGNLVHIRPPSSKNFSTMRSPAAEFSSVWLYRLFSIGTLCLESTPSRISAMSFVR